MSRDFEYVRHGVKYYVHLSGTGCWSLEQENSGRRAFISKERGWESKEFFEIFYEKFPPPPKIDLDLLQRARDMVEHLKTLKEERWVPVVENRTPYLPYGTRVCVKTPANPTGRADSDTVGGWNWRVCTHYKIVKEKK